MIQKKDCQKMEQKRRKVGELHSPPRICSECCQTNNLIQCAGDCKRFFHAKWYVIYSSTYDINSAKAVIFPGEEWLCPDCSKHVVFKSQDVDILICSIVVAIASNMPPIMSWSSVQTLVAYNIIIKPKNAVD